MHAWAWMIASLFGCTDGDGEVPREVPPPEVCRSADHTPDADAARRGLVWVYRESLANGGVPTCPQADSSAKEWKVGFLFDVTHEDCPGRTKSACDPLSAGDRFPRTVRLFDATSPLRLDAVSAGGDRVELPEPLARYCVYYSPTGDKEPPLQKRDRNNPIQARAVVDPVASTAEIQAVYEQTSSMQVGFCPATSVGTPTPVRLTLLDNVPTGVAPGATARHGDDLARVVAGVCEDGECDVELRTRMTLPLEWEPTQARHEWMIRDGGDYGSLDWVAQAIVREVEDWAEAGAEEHLVLNLSMAWHGDWMLDPTTKSELPADVSAVLDALRYARCNGALILAAAGNRTGCGLDTTPMYPAAWASVPVGPNYCGNYRREGAPVLDDGPLLYAVGGLVVDDAPLAIARDGNLPHLAAYGLDVTVPGTSRTITGTSVSTALVAADAARRWSANSWLTADEVMGEVFRSAEPTGLSPEGAHFTVLQSWFDGLLGASAGVRRVASCGVSGDLPSLTFEPVCGGDCSAVRAWSGGDSRYPFSIMRPRANIQPFANPTPMTKPCELCGFNLDSGRATILLGPRFAKGVVGHLAIESASTGWTTWPLGYVDDVLREFQVEGAPCDPLRAALMFDFRGVGYMAEVHVTGEWMCP